MDINYIWQIPQKIIANSSVLFHRADLVSLSPLFCFQAPIRTVFVQCHSSD